jgi:hypothetical protein
MRKMLVINNGSKEEAASVAESLQSSGFAVEMMQLSRGEPLPKDFDGLSGLLILGGPVTLYDQYTTPFLKVYFNT